MWLSFASHLGPGKIFQDLPRNPEVSAWWKEKTPWISGSKSCFSNGNPREQAGQLWEASFGFELLWLNQYKPVKIPKYKYINNIITIFYEQKPRISWCSFFIGRIIFHLLKPNESFADVPQRCQQMLLGGASSSSDPAPILDKVRNCSWEKSKTQPLKQIETTFQGNRAWL